MQYPRMGFESLAGEWIAESISNGAVVATARVTFRWDGHFLRQDSTTEIPRDAPQIWHDNAPRAAWAVFGNDGDESPWTMLYADSRDVSRIYQSSLDDGVWSIWRSAPGFHQRFHGTLSPDGDAIAGVHERSDDGVTWQRDFDQNFRRVSRPAQPPAPPPADGA